MCIHAHSGQSFVYHFYFSDWLQADHHWIIYVWLSVIIIWVIFHLFSDTESMRNDLQCRREKNIFHGNSGLPIDMIWMKQKSVKYLLLLCMTMQTNHSIFFLWLYCQNWSEKQQQPHACKFMFQDNKRQ